MELEVYRAYTASGSVRAFVDTDQFYRLIPRNFIVPKRGGYISAEAFKNTTGTQEMSVDWEALCTAAESMARKPERAVGRFFKPICDRLAQVPVHAPITAPPEPRNIAHCNIVGDKSDEAIRTAIADETRIVLSPPGWAIPERLVGALSEGVWPAGQGEGEDRGSPSGSDSA